MLTEAQQRLLNLIQQAFANTDGGLTMEALQLDVSRRAKRQFTARQIQTLLDQFPAQYTHNNAGIWSRRPPQAADPLDEAEDSSAEEPSASPRPIYRAGNYVVFDLETFDKLEDNTIEVIQIAAQRFDDGKPAAPFNCFVKPPRPVTAATTHITRITQERLDVDGIEPHAALQQFFAYIGTHPLIAHNGSKFDGPVLAQIAARLEIPLPEPFVVLDTLPLSRLLLTPAQVEDHKLGTLAAYYSCGLADAHFADVDVQMLCGVVDNLLREFETHPAAPLAYALLQRVNDRWLDFVPPPAQPWNDDSLAQVISHFGANQTALLPQRAPSGNALGGPTEVETLALLNEYYRHGRERRAAQEQLALLAARAFREQSFAVIEAGTGTGKGLGYLAPAALLARAQGHPVVVSTHGKVLQDQLLESDINGFLRQEILPELRAAVLKGKNNYLSLSALAEEIQDALDESGITRARAYALIMLGSFAVQSTDGDLQMLRGSAYGIEEFTDAQGEVWNLLDRVRAANAVARSALLRALPFGRADFFARAQENAERADIVIINHHRLATFAVVNRRGELPDLISPNLICDEAHTLEEDTTSVLSKRVDLVTLQRTLRALAARRRGVIAHARYKLKIPRDDAALVALDAAIKNIEPFIEALSQRLREFVVRRAMSSRQEQEQYGISVQLQREELNQVGGPALRQAATQLREQLQTLDDALEAFSVRIDAETTNPRMPRVQRALRAVRESFDELREHYRWFWSFQEDNTYLRVISFEKGKLETAAWSLEGKPIAVGALLHDNLWSRHESAVFTSATLQTYGGGFEFFLQRIGLDMLDPTRVLAEPLEPVFDYHKHVLLLLPNHLPTPRDHALKQEYPDAVAAELKRFIPFFGGKTLVLFTARARMNRVHDNLVGELEPLEFPILTQDEDDALERFRNHERTSLLGVRSLWQGVDVRGPSLSFVMMSKLPFPSPGDPLEGARMSAVERAGGSSFYDYMLPKMIFDLKQGFGRLMRASDDHGAVIVLDKRLRSAIYREEVLRSLPNPTIEYKSDKAMYAALAAWMGLPFDPNALPDLDFGNLAALLLANQLPSGFIAENDFERIALPRLLRLAEGISQGKIKQFFDFQLASMRAVLAGKDVLTLTPTGSGKSLTFQLPALIRQGVTIVISPLVALIRDQVVKLRDLGVPFVNALVSGTSAAELEEALTEARAGKTKLLYLAPERLRDPRLRAFLPQIPIIQIVVDEAHCISTWGHDFRPDFLEIPSLLANRGAARETPAHALTATAPPRVQSEIETILEFGVSGRGQEIIRGKYARDNLVYRVYHVANRREREQRAVALVKQIVSNPERGGAGIVYTATRRAASRIADLLRSQNIAAQAYHAGMETADRHQVQEQFMAGDLDVVVATNAFGMGVDKDNIRFVIHFDHPASIEAYAQEAGRAGRDNQEAYAILLYAPETQRTLRFLAQQNMAITDILSEFGETLQKLNVPTLADGMMLTSFSELAREAELDFTIVRVLVYAFEQAGLIARGDDVTLEASVLLNHTPDEIHAHISSADDRALTAQLFVHLNPIAGNRLRYNALAFVQEQNGDPRAADRLFNQLAADEQLLYRPFDRGLLFRIVGDLDDAQTLTRVAARFTDQFRQFNVRLQKMIDYAGLASPQCRSTFLVEHLSGGVSAPHCGKCDLCAPNYPLPYDPTVTFAAEPVRADAAMAILEAARDHNGWLSENTFLKMLLGEAYGGTGANRYQLTPAARNSEQFGVLRGQITRDQLAVVLGRLQDRTLITIVNRTRREGGSYQAIGLTDRGRQVLAGQREVGDAE